MAEVIATFAALSSFLQVVDFATKVACHAHSLLKDRGLQADDVSDAARVAWGYETMWQGVLVDPHTRNVPSTQIVLDADTKRLKDQCVAETKKLAEVLNSLQMNSGYLTTTHGTTQKHPLKLCKAVRIALKIPGKRKELDQRRRHLQELNGLLSTALLRTLSSLHQRQIADTFDAIKEMDKKIEVKLEQLSDSEKLRRLSKEQAKGLRKVHEHIMHNLQYHSMNTRWLNIPDSYPKTYHWAVQSHNDLRSWLRQQNGIFWITGKAGSGKSTLMKFIAESAECQALLQEWSGGNRLLVASYYFWYAGTYLQKSIQGLLQNILLQILRECPELCQVAFPEHYISVIPPDDLPPVTYDRLLVAFDAIAKEENSSAQQRPKRFCLFIDGLDEYHGNPLELIQLLTKLANNPCIKLCVSSRPWNAFRAAFETSTPNLRLEDLSFEDITLYVQGSLQQYGMPCDDEFSALVKEITVRAEGVFLWVFLVVKSILSGFAEEEPIWMLRKRVHDFPQDLEDFFDSILKRVDAVYREHTNQALKLAFMTVRSHEENLESSWLDYYFMRQSSHGLQNALFATTTRAQLKTLEQWKAMRIATRSFLSASCKDLLWLPNPASTSRDGHVEFLHRTVYDYLNSETMQQTMDQQVPQIFHDRRIFHLLRLARHTVLHPGEQKMRLRALRQLHAKSILRPHVDRTEGYMRTFESILLLHKPIDSHDELLPEALPSLAAFGLSNYLAMFRDDETRQPLGYVTAVRTLQPEGIFRAALGKSEMNTFSLSHVKIELLSTLLDFREVRKVTNIVEGGYLLFLSLWVDSEPIPDRAYLRHLWDIAKLFLRKGGFLRNVPIVLPSGTKTSDTLFYRTRVPLDWLREAEQPRLLPDRVQSLMDYSKAYSDGNHALKGVDSPWTLASRPRTLDAIVDASLFGSPAQAVQSSSVPKASQEFSTGFGFTPELLRNSSMEE